MIDNHKRGSAAAAKALKARRPIFSMLLGEAAASPLAASCRVGGRRSGPRGACWPDWP